MSGRDQLRVGITIEYIRHKRIDALAVSWRWIAFSKETASMPGYGSAMRRYFDFSGRSSRSEFWWFTVVSNLVIGGMAQTLDVYAGTEHRCFLLVSLIHLIPSLAVSARRLHDTDQSGWWYLLLFTVLGIILLVAMYCQRGTPGPNRFGWPDDSSTNDAPAWPSNVATPVPLGAEALAELERLAALRLSGALTESEFVRLKARIISAPPGSRIEPTF